MKKPTFTWVVSAAPIMVAAAPNAARRVPKPNTSPSDPIASLRITKGGTWRVFEQ
jgi:hypothetical protein